MRSVNVVVMIFVTLTLCTCCCVIPACNGRWRHGWTDTPTELPQSGTGQPYEAFMVLYGDTLPTSGLEVQRHHLPEG